MRAALESERSRAIEMLVRQEQIGQDTDTANEIDQALDHFESKDRAFRNNRLYIQLFDAETIFCNERHDGTIAQRIRPGLRYNETIFSRETKYRHHATYGQEFSQSALGYEWRRCHMLESIQLLNEEPMSGAFMAEEQTAAVHAASVCFVVLVGPDPLPYAEDTNKLGYYVVRPDGTIEAYALNDARLPEQDIEEYPVKLPSEDE